MKLIIAEKPSVAGAIAKIVGATRKEQGFFSGTDHLVSWCVGHLVQLAPPDAYGENLKSWALDTLPIAPAAFKTVVTESTKQQFQILSALMQRADVTTLVEATDAGREGELIFRLVYAQAGCKKPFQRLWISSLEESSIRAGLQSMKNGTDYDNLYAAAKCRQQADWLVGMNLTRLYSVLYNKTLKAGRVQTPTVGLIVNRQQEIDTFQPVTFYILEAKLEGFSAMRRVETEAEAKALLAHCAGKQALVQQLTREEKLEQPPALYDLTALQRDANRILGFSAQQTLDQLQALYEKKLTTYPRTDSRYITEDMAQTAAALISHIVSQRLYAGAFNPSSANIARITNNKKVTDHHAILPTRGVTPSQMAALPQEQRSILLLVLHRLLCAVSAPSKTAATTVQLSIDGERFQARGTELLQPGFLEVENQLKVILKPDKADPVQTSAGQCKVKQAKAGQPPGQTLPMLTQGALLPVLEVQAQERKTKPPLAYTEDTLLAAMESAGKQLEDAQLREAMKGSGLGTPATRAAIIENIVATGYILRDGKKLLPSEIARAFVAVVDPCILDAELTAQWEQQLGEVQRGAQTEAAFMAGIGQLVAEVVTRMKQLAPQLAPFAGDDRVSLGVCPLCGRRVLEYPKSFSCESGKGGCGFVIWKEIAQKAVSPTQAKKLLAHGKTDLIKGFTAKSGNKFDAMLTLDENKRVAFAFLPRTQ